MNKIHIAPPNWDTYCGLGPDDSYTAYDTVSLPSAEEMSDSDIWCAECVLCLFFDTLKKQQKVMLKAAAALTAWNKGQGTLENVDLIKTLTRAGREQ